MSEPVKVNVVSYGGVKPGQLVVGNGADGSKITLFDAAIATNGTEMFKGRIGLTSWSVALPNLTNGSYMFQGCSGLTSFTADLPKLTNGSQMFYNCSALTSFTANLPELTEGWTMFQASGLTSWTIAMPSLKEASGMFFSCYRLTSFTADLPELTNGSNMFFASGLTSFNADLPKLTNGSQMFSGCSLDASSVLKILTSIPDRAAAGLSAAALHIGRKTNYKDDTDVAALLGTVTPIAAGSYSCKGWTITVSD